jgi:SAM-dependent methyltransferase
MAAGLICTMRDEAPFILEWVAFHRVIGFENIVVFSNDCSDGTDDILSALDQAGFLTHVPHEPDPALSIAQQVSRHCLEKGFFSPDDWVIWLDADEFLNIHAGSGTVGCLIDEVEPADGICLSWRIFGDGGNEVFGGSHIDESFASCAHAGDGWANVKTLFRMQENLIEFFQHKPILSKDFWENGGSFKAGTGRILSSDNELMRKWRRGRRRGKIAQEEAGWDVAQINHYAVRTPALFERKRARGRIGEANATSAQRYTERYHRGLNLNDDRDTSILKWQEATRTEVAGMRLGIERQINLDELIARHYDMDIVRIGDVIAEKPRLPKSGDVPREKIYEHLHNVHAKELDAREYSNTRLARDAMTLLEPQKVIDVGCGIGLLMEQLSNAGANVIGIEGPWLQSDKMVCPSDRYLTYDLENSLPDLGRYDLCCCIEVAEHLSKKRAESFVDDLCGLSDAVLFSAAIPGQGGHGHLNERWQEYWCRLFEGQGFLTYDPIRMGFLRDPKILPWFQQNVLLFLKEGHPKSDILASHRTSPECASMILPSIHRHIIKRRKRRAG